MSFQVFEQGRRIETPWQSLFPRGGVSRLQSTARPGKVEEHPNDIERERHQADLSGPAVRSAHGEHADSPAEVFDSIQQQVPERRPVHTAGQIMVQPVVTLPETSSLLAAWELFQREGFRHIPVIDQQQQLVGLLSERDLLRATSSLPRQPEDGELKSTDVPVRDVMQRRVLGTSPETNLRELALVMLERRIGAMPILESVAGRPMLVGIITRSDILRALTHQVPVEVWT